MFEKLLELERHLRNYFPEAYIHLSMSIDAHPGRSCTEFYLNLMGEGLNENKKFTSYHALVDHIQRLIFTECVVMNRKIEEANGYLKRVNFN